MEIMITIPTKDCIYAEDDGNKNMGALANPSIRSGSKTRRSTQTA